MKRKTGARKGSFRKTGVKEGSVRKTGYQKVNNPSPPIKKMSY